LQRGESAQFSMNKMTIRAAANKFSVGKQIDSDVVDTDIRQMATQI